MEAEAAQPWVLEGAPPLSRTFEDGGGGALQLVLGGSFGLAGGWWEVGCRCRAPGILPLVSRCHDGLASAP